MTAAIRVPNGSYGVDETGFAFPLTTIYATLPISVLDQTGRDRRQWFKLGPVRETLNMAAGAGSSPAAPVASREESRSG
jgi:hypothetical protein